MALKLKITKEQYEKLPKDIQTEYKLDGDIYVLDVSDMEDTGALKRAKDREAELRKEAEKKAKELQTKLDELDTNDAKKSGDLDRLTKGYEAKLLEQKTELTGKLTKLQEATKRTLLDSTALAIATKISTVPSLMSKVIAERLTVDFDGDMPTLKILDKDGKVSSLTVEALKKLSVEETQKEFVDNKEFSSILIGSKASGGAGGGKTTTKLFGGAGGSDEKPVNLATLDHKVFAEGLKQKLENA